MMQFGDRPGDGSFIIIVIPSPFSAASSSPLGLPSIVRPLRGPNLYVYTWLLLTAISVCFIVGISPFCQEGWRDWTPSMRSSASNLVSV